MFLEPLWEELLGTWKVNNVTSGLGGFWRISKRLEERDGKKDQDAGGGNLLDYAFRVVYVSWILRMSSN